MSNLLTHSRLRSLRSCPRKHEYEYELGIRPATPAKALRIGTAVHKAIELEPDVGWSDAIIEATRPYTAMPAWADNPFLQTQWLLEGEMVGRMLVGYFWHWHESEWTVIVPELQVDIGIINPATKRPAQGYTAAIKIDGIVELDDGRLAVKETKTAGESIEPSSDYWRKMRIDPQLSFGVYAAREMGYDVRTVVYDVLRKPEIRPKKVTKADTKTWVATGKYYGEPIDLVDYPTEETIKMWGARLRQDMAHRPEWYFQRMEIARTDDELLEFRRDLWDQYQALRGYRERNHWPRNADSCLAYGKCPYFDICSQGQHLDETTDVPAGMVRLGNVHPELTIEGASV